MIYGFRNPKEFHEAFEKLLDEYGSKVFHNLPQISVLVHLEEFQIKHWETAKIEITENLVVGDDYRKPIYALTTYGGGVITSKIPPTYYQGKNPKYFVSHGMSDKEIEEYIEKTYPEYFV